MSRPVPTQDLEHVTRLIASCMAMWQGARILVTGASGFFGSWLVETFHHANRELALHATLVGVGAPGDDFETKCPQLLGLNGVELIRSDICHLRSDFAANLPKWLARTDAIIHAAIHVNSATYDSEPIPTLETAAKGTWEVLEFARVSCAKRLLFVSSGAVYGTPSPSAKRMDENHASNLDPADHRSAYAEGKRFGETLCAGYLRQYQVPVTIARPFAFIGPHLPLDRHFAIGNFLRDALGGGPVIVQSDGTAMRSYLYAADLAVWLWTILANGSTGRPYNVGSEHAVSLREAANIVARVASPNITVAVRGLPTAGPPSIYLPNTTRARQELALAETVSLEDAVARTLSWHRSTR